MNTQKITTFLLYAILGGFVAWMIWGQKPVEVDVKPYEDRITKLEQKVDSLHNENDYLEIQSDSLRVKIENSTKKINKLKYSIYVIKKETQAKLDSINNYTGNELQQFFTDRYRHDQDSIN